MRWLLTEDWSSHIYAEPFYQRLFELGEDVHAFKEGAFFQVRSSRGVFERIGSTLAKAEHKLRLGPRVCDLNWSLLRRAKELSPEVLFVFRGEHLWPSTLRSIKKLGTYVVGWHNDNPFSPRYPRYAWRHFRRSINLYDRLYAYRSANVEDFRRAGCQRTSLLRSFFLRELNYVLPKAPEPSLACDVAFCGHWEADGRDEYVSALLDSKDIDFRLWGTLWNRSPLATRIEERFGPIRILLKEDYNALLNSAKISLVFLSGMNQDTYTRRCFEIPAAGAFMLAEFTPDLASLFEEGHEAEFFRTPTEMLEKIRAYLQDPAARDRVARAGRKRLLASGHEAMDRAVQVRDDVRRDLAVHRHIDK